MIYFEDLPLDEDILKAPAFLIKQEPHFLNLAMSILTHIHKASDFHGFFTIIVKDNIVDDVVLNINAVVEKITLICRRNRLKRIRNIFKSAVNRSFYFIKKIICCVRILQFKCDI